MMQELGSIGIPIEMEENLKNKTLANMREKAIMLFNGKIKNVWKRSNTVKRKKESVFILDGYSQRQDKY